MKNDSNQRLLIMILKSIVTSYAAFIIDDAAETLKDIHLNDEDSLLLWRRVILTLQRTFEHDQDGKIPFSVLSRYRNLTLQTSTNPPPILRLFRPRSWASLATSK